MGRAQGAENARSTAKIVLSKGFIPAVLARRQYTLAATDIAPGRHSQAAAGPTDYPRALLCSRPGIPHE